MKILICSDSHGDSEIIFENAREIVRRHRSGVNLVLSDIEAEYGEIFTLYEAMYYIVVDMTIKINGESGEIKKTYMYDTILHLHGRACQISSEILCLLKNGFADGALSRCRSLWEIAIYAHFISDYGEDVAEAYWKQAREEIQPKKAVWAKNASCFKDCKKAQQGNISFEDIRSKCKLPQDVIESWSRFNEHSSKVVHAVPISTFGRLFHERAAKDNYVIMSSSLEGLWFPISYALLFLRQSASVFASIALGEEAYNKYYLESKSYKELVKSVSKTFKMLNEWEQVVSSFSSKYFSD